VGLQGVGPFELSFLLAPAHSRTASLACRTPLRQAQGWLRLREFFAMKFEFGKNSLEIRWGEKETKLKLSC